MMTTCMGHVLAGLVPGPGPTLPAVSDANGRVVVIGSLNLDRRLELERLPSPGETVTARAASTGPGGKGLNQAVAAARAGARVELLGCVGDDEAGRELLALARIDGIGLDGVAVIDDRGDRSGHGVGRRCGGEQHRRGGRGQRRVGPADGRGAGAARRLRARPVGHRAGAGRDLDGRDGSGLRRGPRGRCPHDPQPGAVPATGGRAPRGHLGARGQRARVRRGGRACRLR